MNISPGTDMGNERGLASPDRVIFECPDLLQVHAETCSSQTMISSAMDEAWSVDYLTDEHTCCVSGLLWGETQGEKQTMI